MIFIETFKFYIEYKIFYLFLYFSQFSKILLDISNKNKYKYNQNLVKIIIKISLYLLMVGITSGKDKF